MFDTILLVFSLNIIVCLQSHDNSNQVCEQNDTTWQQILSVWIVMLILSLHCVESMRSIAEVPRPVLSLRVLRLLMPRYRFMFKQNLGSNRFKSLIGVVLRGIKNVFKIHNPINSEMCILENFNTSWHRDTDRGFHLKYCISILCVHIFSIASII